LSINIMEDPENPPHEEGEQEKLDGEAENNAPMTNATPTTISASNMGGDEVFDEDEDAEEMETSGIFNGEFSNDATKMAVHSGIRKGPKICNNCQATSSPMWRNGPESMMLCNACGIYFSKYKKLRPAALFTRDHERAKKKRIKKAVKELAPKSLLISSDDEKKKFLETERARLYNHIQYVHEKTGANFFIVEGSGEDTTGSIITHNAASKNAVEQISKLIGTSLSDSKFFAVDESQLTPEKRSLEPEDLMTPKKSKDDNEVDEVPRTI
jgi:hypothetical protein